MERYKCIIVSDVHLGTEDSKASEFLDFLNSHHADIFILNGDFIDGWAIAKGRKWRSKHTKVVSKILDISRKVPVVWIRGNHDEFLHDFMHMHLGKLQVEEHYVLDLGDGRKYFIFHGDVLDVFVAKWKWIAKLGSTGYELALRINTLYNKWRAWRGLPYYSISKDIKAGVKAAVNYITDFEVSATKLARQHNCTGVICGHIHVPEDRQIAGIHYLNSGDWVENMTAILIDQGGNIEIREFQRGVDKRG
jgi:UDP-2,3-diacylglucosamine pyrophosphatase LpxH